MRARFAAAAVLVTLAASVCSVLLARELAAVEPELPPLVDLSGTIRAIDPGRRQLTLSAPSGQCKLTVGPATTLFAHGGPASLEDFAKGQKVRAIFEPGPEAPEAQWIELEDEG
ncbi:MAG: copper-binding protein [Myxococcales bacterium]|nr:copper-binding protein [Myxococcales bacterium]